MAREDITIFPVAKVSFGFGGGVGTGLRQSDVASGGGASAAPAG